MHLYNVYNYGAVADGVTDCTPAIQAAINAAYANKGGIIYFPWSAKGIYRLHGALVNSGGTGIGSPNSQLYVQFVSSATGTQGSIPIVLLGEEMPSPNASALSNYTINKGGPIIYSDIAGSGTLPAIFGSDQSSSTGTFNLASVTVRNLDFRVAANIGASGPTMSALNLYNVAFAEVDHVVCELDTSSNLSVSPTAETFGIYMPKVNNGAWCPINNVLVTGYKYGIILTEHCVWNNLSVTTCEEGYVFPGAIHSLSGGRMLAQWCKNTLSGPIGSIIAPSGNPSTTELNIQELDIEWQPSGTGNWFDKNVVVLDASNNLYGHMYYHMVKRGIGVDNSGYNKSGGTNLYADPILTNQFTTAGLVTPVISGPTASGTIVITSNSTTPGFIGFGNSTGGGIKDATSGSPHFIAGATSGESSQFAAFGTGGASNQGYEIHASSASSYGNGMNFFNSSGTDIGQLIFTNPSYSGSPIAGNEFVLGNYATSGIITMWGNGSSSAFRVLTNNTEAFRINAAHNWLLNTTAAAANQVPMSNGTIMGWQTIAPFLGSGQTTLVAGTKAISLTGVTTSSKAFVQAVSQGGTVSTTFEYSAVCTSGTVTITAITTGNVTNALDTSTLNYYVIN